MGACHLQLDLLPKTAMKFVSFFKTSRYMQCIAALTAGLGILSCSTISSWNSPAIVKLTSENSPIGVSLNSTQASWVASVSMLGFIVGAGAVGLFSNKLGPKNTLLFGAIPTIAAWTIIAFTTSIPLLIAMRCVSGITDGILIAVLPLYVGEITDKDIRGGLIIAMYVTGSLGNVFVLSLGPFLSYQNLALFCGAVPILFFFVFLFMPDSPYFLFKKRDFEGCKRNLKRLVQNADEMEIEKRLLEIEQTVIASDKFQTSCTKFVALKNVRVGFFLVVVAIFFTQLSGSSTLKSYLQTIIESSGSSITPEVSSIIFGSVQVPAVLLAAFLVDRMGRKSLYAFSAFVCGATLFAEGTYFYLEEDSPHLLENVRWLPTLSLTIYMIVAPIGIHSIPYVLIGEVLADEVKSAASGTCTIISGLLAFIFSMFFLPLSDELGLHVMFFIFGCSCFAAFLFGAFVLPETKRKSFLEIQEILKTKMYC